MTLPRSEIIRYRHFCAAEQARDVQGEGQGVRATKFGKLKIALDGLLESVLEDDEAEAIFTKIHSDICRLLANSADILDEAG